MEIVGGLNKLSVRKSVEYELDFKCKQPMILFSHVLLNENSGRNLKLPTCKKSN